MRLNTSLTNKSTSITSNGLTFQFAKTGNNVYVKIQGNLSVELTKGAQVSFGTVPYIPYLLNQFVIHVSDYDSSLLFITIDNTNGSMNIRSSNNTIASGTLMRGSISYSCK